MHVCMYACVHLHTGMRAGLCMWVRMNASVHVYTSTCAPLCKDAAMICSGEGGGSYKCLHSAAADCMRV